MNPALKEYLAADLQVHRANHCLLPRVHKLGRRLGPDVVAQLVREYSSDMPAATLAERYGISKTAVQELLERAGVLRHRNVMTDDMLAAAQAMREQGMLYREIGAQLGVHKDTVRRAILRSQ